MEGIRCPECGIEFDNEPDMDESYCPWCGAMNPDLAEWLAWEGLLAEAGLG